MTKACAFLCVSSYVRSCMCVCECGWVLGVSLSGLFKVFCQKLHQQFAGVSTPHGGNPHTHPHTHTLSLSPLFPPTHTQSLLALTHSLTHTQNVHGWTHTLSYTLTITNTHTLTLTLSLTHTLSLAHTFSLAQSNTHALFLSYTLNLSKTHPLTLSLSHTLFHTHSSFCGGLCCTVSLSSR